MSSKGSETSVQKEDGAEGRGDSEEGSLGRLRDNDPDSQWSETDELFLPSTPSLTQMIQAYKEDTEKTCVFEEGTINALPLPANTQDGQTQIAQKDWRQRALPHRHPEGLLPGNHPMAGQATIDPNTMEVREPAPSTQPQCEPAQAEVTTKQKSAQQVEVVAEVVNITEQTTHQLSQSTHSHPKTQPTPLTQTDQNTQKMHMDLLGSMSLQGPSTKAATMGGTGLASSIGAQQDAARSSMRTDRPESSKTVNVVRDRADTGAGPPENALILVIVPKYHQSINQLNKRRFGAEKGKEGSQNKK